MSWLEFFVIFFFFTPVTIELAPRKNFRLPELRDFYDWKLVFGEKLLGICIGRCYAALKGLTQYRRNLMRFLKLAQCVLCVVLCVCVFFGFLPKAWGC